MGCLALHLEGGSLVDALVGRFECKEVSWCRVCNSKVWSVLLDLRPGADVIGSTINTLHCMAHPLPQLSRIWSPEHVHSILYKVVIV